jgi:hypothetical protein
VSYNFLLEGYRVFFEGRLPSTARRRPMSSETAADARKNAANTRGKPFERGNPGKPKGARHRVTLAAEILLEGEAEAITRKAIELAKAGDGPALRLCMDRIYPARKHRPVRFGLPPLEKVGDAVAANAALVGAVASGDLTPSEAGELAKLVEAYTRAVEATDIQDRLTKLEAAQVKR